MAGALLNSLRLARAGFAGANVTVPHKEAAFALCDRVDAGAKKAGAANTLVFAPDGTIAGRRREKVRNMSRARVEKAAGVFNA